MTTITAGAQRAATIDRAEHTTTAALGQLSDHLAAADTAREQQPLKGWRAINDENTRLRQAVLAASMAIDALQQHVTALTTGEPA